MSLCKLELIALISNYMYYFCAGLCKKLEKAAQLKECGLIGAWLSSIKNHLYWCAASSDQANKDEIEAKYRSLLNHVVNGHSHDTDIFPECIHGALDEEEVRDKLWFDERKLSCCSFLHRWLYSLFLCQYCTTLYFGDDLQTAMPMKNFRRCCSTPEQ